MPFEIAPQVEAPVKFDDVADAILRGCALTLPTSGAVCSKRSEGRITHACVWLAYQVGAANSVNIQSANTPRYGVASSAYLAVHRTDPIDDYTSGRLTREQIAERIRAL